jgi:hypothetical protein
MTPDEFRAFAVSAFGADRWASAAARFLDIDRRALLRLLKDNPIPAWMAERVAEGIQLGAIDPWPRDEFIHGHGVTEDGKQREYIIHAQTPRFIARVVWCEPGGPPLDIEEPVDALQGVTYGSADLTLCEINWIDAIDPGQVQKWLEAACDAVDEMYSRAEAEDG